jgi:hypothetical protein
MNTWAHEKAQDYRFTASLEKMNAQLAFMSVEVPFGVEQESGTMPCTLAAFYGKVHQ